MQVITYWNYEELFGEITYHKIYLPMSCLKEEDYIDLLINDLIKDFEPINVICYSSFLNMVCQTQGTDYIVNQSRIELGHLGINSKVKKDGILFHRSNLLYLISL